MWSNWNARLDGRQPGAARADGSADADYSAARGKNAQTAPPLGLWLNIRMPRLFRRLFQIGFVALILIQLAPSGRSNPPVDASRTIERTLTVPPEVKAILDRSCRNCHSNQTVWPPYAYVAPVSWLLVWDVSEARDDMNLSEWGVANPDAQRDTLLEVCKRVKRGEMPLWSVHPPPPRGGVDARRRPDALHLVRTGAQGAEGAGVITGGHPARGSPEPGACSP